MGNSLTHFIVFWIAMPGVMVLWFWVLLRFHPAFGQFTWSIFCDNQGKPGYGRVASAISLLAVLLWNTHIVWKTEVIPTTALITELMFCSGFFFIEKLPELVARFKGIPELATVITPAGSTNGTAVTSVPAVPDAGS